ncbi:MAG: YncE family protein [Bryobacteraceae bacterium]
MTYQSILRSSKIALVCGATLFGAMAAEPVVVVVNSGDSTASVYHVARITNGDANLKLAKTLPTGKTPNEVCISPSGSRAYVSNRGESSITVLDLEKLTVASTITEPGLKNPDGCLVTSDGSSLYVTAVGADSVFQFSTADHHKVREIKVGKEPRRLVFSPDGARLYVSNGEERFVSVIDVKSGTVTAKIPAGRDNRAMIFTPDGKYLVIANVSDDTVQFVKAGETETEFTMGVPRSPQRLLAIPEKQVLFALGRFDKVISFLDLRPLNAFGRYFGSISVGGGPWGMARSADGETVYVTNTSDDTISFVDLRMMRVTHTIKTGKGPLGIAAH